MLGAPPGQRVADEAAEQRAQRAAEPAKHHDEPRLDVAVAWEWE